ncbi:unnamed protein product [Ixodes persulcatus]
MDVFGLPRLRWHHFPSRLTSDTAAKDVWPFRVCAACGSVRERGRAYLNLRDTGPTVLVRGLNPGDFLLGMWGNVTL